MPRKDIKASVRNSTNYRKHCYSKTQVSDNNSAVNESQQRTIDKSFQMKYLSLDNYQTIIIRSE
jgi:hypothetical protein